MLNENYENYENYEENHEIFKKFKKIQKKYYVDLKRDVQQYKHDKSYADKIKLKYTHLKRHKISIRKNTPLDKILSQKAFVMEIINHYNNSSDKQFGEFTQKEQKILYKLLTDKIQGIYKHAQAKKTKYCNINILLTINGNSEPSTITICVTKNTLEANSQWFDRLCKDLKERFPNKQLKQLIMIISSSKNKDKRVTQCKKFSDAWVLLSKEHSFKVIFLCSNKTRFTDITKLCELNNNLCKSFQKKFRIQHDEAHNSKEGIPAYRDLVEDILCDENVISFSPISATIQTISDPKNPIWSIDNLEKNAHDYTKFEEFNIKSNSLDYSAYRDAKKITFEELDKNTLWKEYHIDTIPEDVVEYVESTNLNKYNKKSRENLKQELEKELKLYKKQENKNSKINIDQIESAIDTYDETELRKKCKKIYIQRRSKLEFCSFMKKDREKEAINRALNALNMNNLLNINYFNPSQFNLHIISTPRRNCVTEYISREASKQKYNPIVLALYGSKFHLRYNNQNTDYEYDDGKQIEEIMGSGQFNEKIDKLLTYLKKKGVDIQRPLIMIGNYVPTGESLSFVNYKYGIVKGNIKLISTNAEEDYQEASRSNYMHTLFKRNIPNWIEPKKYLVGESRFHENCKSYEKANDDRIDDFENGKNSNTNTTITIPEKLKSNSGITATPIKITIGDFDHPIVKQLIEIQRKPKKKKNEKKTFLEILENCCNNEEIDVKMIDKTNKFNFNTFELVDFRTYRKKENKDPTKGSWKFSSYKIHHDTDTPFMNNKNNHKKFQCEILTCEDQYVVEDDNGKVINFKKDWWIGYKYE